MNNNKHKLSGAFYRILSSVERRTINDQEATDLILVHGVFIMFFNLFIYCYWYTTIVSCIILTQKCSEITTQLSHFLLMNLEFKCKKSQSTMPFFGISRSTTIKFKVMSREYLPIWTIHFLIKILSLFQGNTLMIDFYVVWQRLAYNVFWIRYQDVIITFEFLR